MKDNTKLIKKIKLLKRKTRNKDIRIKLELFVLALKLNNITEACARRGLGRTFYHKWWKRFVKSSFNLSSLEEKSRRTKKSPNKLSRKIENEIRELRALGNGCRMIQGIFNRKGCTHSTSTINHILNGRKKPSKKMKNKLNPHNRRYELPIPGQRLQVDVKYLPYKIKGEKGYVYVAIDECTRWRHCKVYPAINGDLTVEFMRDVLENAPFPVFCVQTDNGQEFTNRFLKTEKTHPLDQWCEANGIEHKCIPPGVKELNGKVERSHRIDEQYFYWRSPRESFEGLNLAIKEWLKYYNEERPHGGLGYMTPKEKIEERLIALPNEDVDCKLQYIKNRYQIEAQMKYYNIYNFGLFRCYKLAA